MVYKTGNPLLCRSLGLAGLDCRQVSKDSLARGIVTLNRSADRFISCKFCSFRVVLKKSRLGEEQLRTLLSCTLGPSRWYTS